jgi:hypothetical protein
MIYEVEQVRTLTIDARNKTEVANALKALAQSGVELTDGVLQKKAVLRSCVAIHKTKILK